MDENIWKIAQIIMWVLGIQTTIIIAVIGAMWASMLRKFEVIEKKFDSVDRRIDKLDEKLTDIDRQVCRMEGAFNNKECCMIKDNSQIKKAE